LESCPPAKDYYETIALQLTRYKAGLRQAQSMNMKCGGNFCFENFKTLKLLSKTLKLQNYRGNFCFENFKTLNLLSKTLKL